MKLFKFIAPDDFNLFLFGDAHTGNKAFSDSAYKFFINTITSRFKGLPAGKNYGIDFGDPADFITRTDKRFDPDIHQVTPLRQIENFAELYQPIKHAVLCFMDSNHCQTLNEIGNVAQFVCKQIWGYDEGIRKYGTESVRVTFVTQKGNRMFKLYGTHGRKSINSAADDIIRIESNQMLSLKRHLKNKASDCCVMAKGHTHKLIVVPPKPKLCLKDNTKKLLDFYPDPTEYHRLDYIPEELRWYVNTGSFLRLYALGVNTYSERAEYDPIDLGFAVVLVRDRKIQDIKRVAYQ